MTRHGKRRQPPPTKAGLSPQLPGTPSLVELERFSSLGLVQWRNKFACLRELYTEVYFGIEAQRATSAVALTEALRANAVTGPVEFDGWARIVDYQYSLKPLSVAGSLATEGGRFNVGRRLNAAAFAPFPALYVASSYETAYAEKFGVRVSESRNQLASDELVLRRPSSFTCVRLQGSVELCFDAGDLLALRAFASVIARFRLPERALRIARSMRLVPPAMIRSPSALRSQLLHPHWNTLPMHFDLPSNAQTFGRLVAAAGFHGIRYPSVREPQGYCVAIFPQNWRGSMSVLEVADAQPEHARLTRIDGDTELFE